MFDNPAVVESYPIRTKLTRTELFLAAKYRSVLCVRDLRMMFYNFEKAQFGVWMIEEHRSYAIFRRRVRNEQGRMAKTKNR